MSNGLTHNVIDVRGVSCEKHCSSIASAADAGIDAIESGGAALRDLDLIDAPTLIAWPGGDRLIPHTQHGQRFADEIPDVTVRVLPEVGRLPMYDNPTTRAVLPVVAESGVARDQWQRGHRREP